MSLAIWPRSVNRFVKATALWLALLQSGQMTPPAILAEIAGQGAPIPPAPV